jgi:hypothetical protein
MTKVWQILLTGLTCLVIFIYSIVDLRIAYAIASGILFIGFAAGFLLQPKSEFCSMFLPAMEMEYSPILDGNELGESFPQVITFRIEVVNLAFLGFLGFIPIAVILWVASGNDISPGSGFPPTNVVLVPIFLFLHPLSLIGTWLRERYLLHRGKAYWALFRPSRNHYSYEFFDDHGDRWGGVEHSMFKSPNELDDIALAVARTDDLDESKLSFSFRFHRFIVIDRRHAPIPLEGENVLTNLTTPP